MRVKIDPKSYLDFGKREEGERSREERRDEEGTGVATWKFLLRLRYTPFLSDLEVI